MAQYLVTFKANGGNYAFQYVAETGTVVLPENPTGPVGWHFVKWVIEGETEAYDFSTPVTAALTLEAVGTTNPVWILVYDTVGGSSIQSLIVEQDNNVAHVTKAKPVKEGHVFKEWNTSPTGDGMTFEEDAEITLVGNYTLYAVWEDTSSVNYKVTSLADRANEFLSGEAIEGVSNLMLTIGIITGVVSLLAVIAIARK